MGSDRELGEKQWRWYDSERYGHKVGVACYDYAVVVHFPAGVGDGGMDIHRCDRPELSDALGRLYRRALEDIGNVYDDLEYRDDVALRRALA